MRCPKCGYISFDQQETCPRCSRNLQEISSELKGTGVKGGKTFFLKSVLEESEEKSAAAEDTEGGAEDDFFGLEEFEADEDLESSEDTGIDFFLDEEEEGGEQVAGEEEAADLLKEDLGAEAAAGEPAETGEDLQLDFESRNEAAVSEMAAGGDEVVPEEEEPARPEEPDLKLQLESDIMEEEPDEAGLEYDLENIDMSDLVIEDEDAEEGEEEGEEPRKEKGKGGSSGDDLPDIDL